MLIRLGLTIAFALNKIFNGQLYLQIAKSYHSYSKKNNSKIVLTSSIRDKKNNFFVKKLENFEKLCATLVLNGLTFSCENLLSLEACFKVEFHPYRPKM